MVHSVVECGGGTEPLICCIAGQNGLIRETLCIGDRIRMSKLVRCKKPRTSARRACQRRRSVEFMARQAWYELEHQLHPYWQLQKKNHH